jgi:hypothetical protein
MPLPSTPLLLFQAFIPVYLANLWASYTNYDLPADQVGSQAGLATHLQKQISWSHAHTPKSELIVKTARLSHPTRYISCSGS